MILVFLNIIQGNNVEPLISVIVPIYNVEKYLDRCVKSIINQTYRNLEILLIDDGSPDESPRMADVWRLKDNRIQVFHKSNGGLSDARNYGLDRITGDYVAFVDSDDYIEPDMYKILVEAIQRNNCELACCGRFYTKLSIDIPSRYLENEQVFSNVEAIRELLNNGCIEEAAWDKLYNAKLWDNIRFPWGEINEDIVVMPKILSKCSRIVHVGKAFYHYCYNGSSITNSGYNIKKDVMLKHMLDLSIYIKDFYPQEYRYVNVLRAKYAMTTLMAIVLAEEEKKYNNSYEQYHRILKETYLYMIWCENFSIKQKMEGFLLVIGMYRMIWNCLHIIKK